MPLKAVSLGQLIELDESAKWALWYLEECVRDFVNLPTQYHLGRLRNAADYWRQLDQGEEALEVERYAGFSDND